MGELGSGSGTSYPTALDTDTNTESSTTYARANVPNDLAAAVVSIETELGINPPDVDDTVDATATASDLATRLDHIVNMLKTITAKANWYTDPDITLQALKAEHNTDGTHFSVWFQPGETWTYASADDPTFTFTISGDKTNKYSAGMRIKLFQASTWRYFIITVVSYGAPDTTVTIYGGTDYDLADEAITYPAYSSHKAPVGFPLDPDKWTVEVTDTTERNQADPTADVWYNLSSVNITIPIGAWNVEYSVCYGGVKAAALNMFFQSTLSTANNSESDVDFTTYICFAGAAGNLQLRTTVFRRKILSLAAKTVYYLNTLSQFTTVDTMSNYNNESKLIIRSICAYL